MIPTNHNKIKSIISLCRDGQQYDIIIDSYFKYDSICYVQLRYLNYANYGDYINLTLFYPQCLITAALTFVKITNLNECINL